MREQLVEWNVESELVDNAELVVSELATNAIVHTEGGRISVVTARGDGQVMVSVTDTGPHRCVRRRDAGPDEESGRGLHVVHVLANRWGTRLVGGGTCVWVHLRAASAEGTGACR
ncbi:ATP-binding protein [Streptomyces daliensis]|uniref:ATP-binding protein n=1 Tax=Streptomyces daliensis TaxID=299421 RepID=A0A8T4IIQ5_9ACTN|nr:ATP-binding protein [Streptomyces daliensis]